MIKVIKPGNTTREIECKYCNALLSYHLKDVTTAWEEYAGGIFSIEYIKCPECGSRVVVSSEINEKITEVYKNWKLNRGFF